MNHFRQTQHGFDDSAIAQCSLIALGAATRTSAALQRGAPSRRAAEHGAAHLATARPRLTRRRARSGPLRPRAVDRFWRAHPGQFSRALKSGRSASRASASRASRAPRPECAPACCATWRADYARNVLATPTAQRMDAVVRGCVRSPSCAAPTGTARRWTRCATSPAPSASSATRTPTAPQDGSVLQIIRARRRRVNLTRPRAWGLPWSPAHRTARGLVLRRHARAACVPTGRVLR